MNHWASIKLAEATTKVGSGATPKGGQESYQTAGIPLIRSMNVRFEGFDREGLAFLSAEQARALDGVVVAPNDVLLNITGASIGRVTLAPADIAGGRVNQHVCIIRPRSGLEPKFLGYFLRAPAMQQMIMAEQYGATRQALTKAMVLDFDVPLPPLNEQRRIVANLDTLLARSRRAKDSLDAVPALLERFRQSVLAAAFRGDLTRDWREAHSGGEPTSKLLERIRSERRRSWEDAELGRMRVKGKVPKDNRWKDGYEAPVDVDATPPVEGPSSWMWTTLESVAFIKGGLALGKKRIANDVLVERPYLRVANVQRGHLDLREVKTIRVTPEEARELRLEPGDVLLNEGGDRDKLGRGWIWSGEVPNCIHQNHVFRARPVAGGIHPKLLSWYGNTFGQNYFLDKGTQTTNLASISMTKVKRLPVPVIPIEEQVVLVERVEALLSVVSNLAKQHEQTISRLRVLDKSLMAKAFAGKLVPQDPDDEPASVLLGRIRAERQSATTASTRSRTAELPKGNSKRVI